LKVFDNRRQVQASTKLTAGKREKSRQHWTFRNVRLGLRIL
jgi:hypothetical protein